MRSLPVFDAPSIAEILRLRTTPARMRETSCVASSAGRRFVKTTSRSMGGLAARIVRDVADRNRGGIDAWKAKSQTRPFGHCTKK